MMFVEKEIYEEQDEKMEQPFIEIRAEELARLMGGLYYSS